MLLSLLNLSLTTLGQIILTCICANFEYIHSAIVMHTTMYVFFFSRFSFLNNFRLLKKGGKNRFILQCGHGILCSGSYQQFTYNHTSLFSFSIATHPHRILDFAYCLL